MSQEQLYPEDVPPVDNPPSMENVLSMESVPSTQGTPSMQGTLPIEIVRLLLPPLIIAAGVAIFFALLSLRKEPETKPTDVELPAVATATVESQDDGLTIDVDGLVVPFREISLSAEVSGRVVGKSAVCRAGNFVTKGTMLIEIDPSDYKLAVKQLDKELAQAEAGLKELDEETASTDDLVGVALSSLKLQEKELARLVQLARRDYATDSQIDTEERNVLAAKNAYLTLRGKLRTLQARHVKLESSREFMAARKERAELDLSRATIVAPIDGVVVSDSVEVDSYVSKGTPLAVIEDITAVEVKCNLQMSELYWIWQQPPANDAEDTIHTPRVDYQIPKTPATVGYGLAGREYIWDGLLSRFEGIGLDQDTRTVPCRVLVKSPRDVRIAGSTAADSSGQLSELGPPALVRGMYVSVKIHTKPESSLLKVPEVAVRPGGRLWRVRDGKLHEVEVYVVEVSDGVATIRANGSDVIVGDKVVVTPLAFVEDGMAVKEEAKQ
jgi:multidrug efflux pump subunit AcrA (membrane-fusion protein)